MARIQAVSAIIAQRTSIDRIGPAGAPMLSAGAGIGIFTVAQLGGRRSFSPASSACLKFGTLVFHMGLHHGVSWAEFT